MLLTLKVSPRPSLPISKDNIYISRAPHPGFAPVQAYGLHLQRATCPRRHRRSFHKRDVRDGQGFVGRTSRKYAKAAMDPLHTIVGFRLKSRRVDGRHGRERGSHRQPGYRSGAQRERRKLTLTTA